MPEVRIVARNFMDMVSALPAMKLDKLYDSSFICEAVLRSFPLLAKKYVLQMTFIDSPVTAKSFEEWVIPDGYSKHKVAIDRLLQLRVFIEVNDRKKETGYKMNPKFQRNMQKYLVSGGTLPREPMTSTTTGRLPSLEDLEVYALEQWVVPPPPLHFSFLVATYKLSSSRKANKFQFFRDASFPARSFEFKGK